MLFIAVITPPWMLLAKPILLKREHEEKQRQREKRGGDIELIESSSDVSPRNDIEEYNKIELAAMQLDSVPDSHRDMSEEKSLLNPSEKQEVPKFKTNNIEGGQGEKSEGFETSFQGTDEKYLLKVMKLKASSQFDFQEIAVHQLIETIEFCLGTISNTASYLRLWALSLAHSQLAKVFYEQLIGRALESDSSVVLFLAFVIWFGATVSILMAMDVMECFLHTIRLHWVEFQNKFYSGRGYKFMPLDYQQELDKANI